MHGDLDELATYRKAIAVKAGTLTDHLRLSSRRRSDVLVGL